MVFGAMPGSRSWHDFIKTRLCTLRCIIMASPLFFMMAAWVLLYIPMTFGLDKLISKADMQDILSKLSPHCRDEIETAISFFGEVSYDCKTEAQAALKPWTNIDVDTGRINYPHMPKPPDEIRFRIPPVYPDITDPLWTQLQRPEGQIFYGVLLLLILIATMSIYCCCCKSSGKKYVLRTNSAHNMNAKSPSVGGGSATKNNKKKKR